MQVTWEPASTLPATIVEEFEKGVIPHAVQSSNDHYGHGTTTINVVVEERSSEQQPSKKSPQRPSPC